MNKYLYIHKYFFNIKLLMELKIEYNIIEIILQKIFKYGIRNKFNNQKIEPNNINNINNKNKKN